MIHLLLIAIFVAMALSPPQSLLGPTWAEMIWPANLAGLGGIYGLLIFLTHVLVKRRAAMLDATGHVRHVFMAERMIFVGRVLALVAHTGGLLFLGSIDGAARCVAGYGAAGGWAIVVDLLARAIVSTGPLAVIVMGWWSFYPIERRLREAALFGRLESGKPVHRPYTRGEFVWSNIRHQMLLVIVPVALLSVWARLIGPILTLLGVPLRGASAEWVEFGAQIFGVIVVMITMPLAMRVLWDTTPLGPGDLRDRVLAICARHHVKVGQVLVWRTAHSMINGALMGFISPARFILLTDALLESLGTRHVEAVAAHEVAHAKRRHLPWLGFSTLVCFLAISSLVQLVAWGGGLSEQAVEGDAGVLTLVAVLSIVATAKAFGMISRRFEWQADAFAAVEMSRRLHEDAAAAEPPAPLSAPADPASPKLPEAPSSLQGEIHAVTPGGIEAMVGALGAVSDLNGIPLAKPSWRHGSIAERQRRLRSLAGIPFDRLPIDRQVRRIKLVVALTALAMVAIEVWSSSHVGESARQEWHDAQHP